MAGSAYASNLDPTVGVGTEMEKRVPDRHSATVRITHWIFSLGFLALLLSGIELVISHPRFYWGEEGNVNTPPLISLPIPSSREAVPTGYNYVLPDQNGWSRYLQFQSAWVVALVGLWYGVHGFWSGHFRKDLMPSGPNSSPRALARAIAHHLSFRPVSRDPTYNPLQRITYLVVIFVALPLMIWTGLAMSPAVTAALPFLVDSLGGHQSARTLHFIATLLLTLFLVIHIVMVIRGGFRQRMRAMLVGGP
jgi:thiosulfate reductase cytochrome b subunit